MLGTKDLMPSRVGSTDIRGFRPDENYDMLVVGQMQVLGGATIEAQQPAAGTELKGPIPCTLTDCWGVTDLTEAHWAALLNRGAEAIAVPRGVSEAIRFTLERYHADGARRIQSMDDRRQGVIDAVRAIVAGQAQGGSGGPQ